MRKYQLPLFLEGIITQATYDKWIDRKARSHFKRDTKRGNKIISLEIYKVSIHQAVCDSKGVDYYTGELLDWSIVSKYNNDDSKQNGRQYKRQFALLPTVDHVDDGLGHPNFKICSWRTNDAKNDLSYDGFVELCKKVIHHNQNNK